MTETLKHPIYCSSHATVPCREAPWQMSHLSVPGPKGTAGLSLVSRDTASVRNCQHPDRHRELKRLWVKHSLLSVIRTQKASGLT